MYVEPSILTWLATYPWLPIVYCERILITVHKTWWIERLYQRLSIIKEQQQFLFLEYESESEKCGKLYNKFGKFVETMKTLTIKMSNFVKEKMIM